MTKLYSHNEETGTQDLPQKIVKIRNRLLQEGDSDLGPLTEKLEILDDLTKFEFGRYLIANQGINGWWNHYIAYTYPRLQEHQKPALPTERMLIETLGSVDLRVRLEMVVKLLQRELREGISLLSVPCGLMADLSSLDYSAVSSFKLTGVDLDPESLEYAVEFNKSNHLEDYSTFLCRDAWELKLKSQFDVVVSMGLNLYVGDVGQVLKLYKSFYDALKPGGKLMASFMAPHRYHDPNTESNFDCLDQEAYRRFKIIYWEIVKTKVVNRTSSATMIHQLKSVGFNKVDIEFSKCKSPNFAIAIK